MILTQESPTNGFACYFRLSWMLLGKNLPALNPILKYYHKTQNLGGRRLLLWPPFEFWWCFTNAHSAPAASGSTGGLLRHPRNEGKQSPFVSERLERHAGPDASLRGTREGLCSYALQKLRGFEAFCDFEGGFEKGETMGLKILC